MIDNSSRNPRCSCILVPRHNSALTSAAFRDGKRGWERLLYEVCGASASGLTDATTSCCHQVDASQRGRNIIHQSCGIESYNEVLILQCHSEGVMWRGILPIFFPSTAEVGSKVENDLDRFASRKLNGHHLSCKVIHSNKGSRSNAPRKAIFALVNHFHNCIRRVPRPCAVISTRDEDDDDDVRALDDFFWYTINKPSASYNPIILLLLPPNTSLHHQQCCESTNFYYSRTPSTAPINPFALRLILNENNFIRLTSLSAYISTLGGGFFLCRYLSTAIALARQQCALALLRGDSMMALKCRINEGYCYIHGGKLNKGKKIIRLALRDAIKMQLEQEGSVVANKDQLQLQHPPDGELSELVVITNMCHSALRFANLIKAASLEVTESELLGNDTGFDGTSLPSVDNEQHNYLSPTEDIHHKERVSSTHDDFQRIRIIKDRKWRR